MKTAIRFLIFALALQASIASAYRPVDDEPSESFYQDSRSSGSKGWYWYEEPPPKEEPAKPEPPKPAPQEKQKPEAKDDRNLTSKKMSYRELWDMHPADFKKLYNAVEEKAVQTLSPEDVYETKRLRDVARRKSSAFAAVDSYVNMMHPELSTEDAIPAAAPGRDSQYRARTNVVEERLKSESHNFALVYFYSRDCDYCIEASKILKMFKGRNHWDIRPISKETNPEAFAKFSISTTPSIMLIGKNMDKNLLVASGVIALDELEKRIYRNIRLVNKEITPEQFFMYEFEENGALDPLAPLNERR